MTPIQYADKLRLQILELQRDNKPLRLAATSATTEMATRIFIKGDATAGGGIGKYNDDKFLYLNPTNTNIFGRSKIGTPGTFKNGKKKKTVKVTYKGYKSLLGKPAGGAFVNLELSGDLKSDFTNQDVTSNLATPERITNDEYVVGWRNRLNVLKAEGNENRFKKKIFNLSVNEKRTFYEVAEFELRKMFA
jgi:hypothetical protein